MEEQKSFARDVNEARYVAETFARDLIQACHVQDPHQFSDHKFETLTDTEKKWILGLGDFMFKNGWKKG